VRENGSTFGLVSKIRREKKGREKKSELIGKGKIQIHPQAKRKEMPRFSEFKIPPLRKMKGKTVPANLTFKVSKAAPS
jgi:hypothetical protein